MKKLNEFLKRFGAFFASLFIKIKKYFSKGFFKHLAKKPGFDSFAASFTAIIGGLVVGFIIMIITSPANSFMGFVTLIGGWLFQGGLPGIGNWIYSIGPLMLAGLSVGFAFKTGLFNIGAAGQYTVGMFFSLIVGILCPGLGIFQWPLAILAGIVGGAAWGFIPGFLKAHFNVNEVITSIMFNYIAMYAVNMIIKASPLLYNSAKGETKAILATAYTPTLGLRALFPLSGIDIGFIIAIFAAVLIYIILHKTTFGYELQACGLNRNASMYGGINEKRSIVLSMTIAGALAGLAGSLFILASGAYGSGTFYEPTDTLLATGFDGIAIALLGMSNPIGIVFSTLFITFIQRGGYFMQTYGFKFELINIIVSVIIYFSALSLLVRGFVNRLRSDKKRKAEGILLRDAEVVERAKDHREMPGVPDLEVKDGDNQ